MSDPSLSICRHGDDPTVCDICWPEIEALMDADEVNFTNINSSIGNEDG